MEINDHCLTAGLCRAPHPEALHSSLSLKYHLCEPFSDCFIKHHLLIVSAFICHLHSRGLTNPCNDVSLYIFTIVLNQLSYHYIPPLTQKGGTLPSYKSEKDSPSLRPYMALARILSKLNLQIFDTCEMISVPLELCSAGAT